MAATPNPQSLHWVMVLTVITVDVIMAFLAGAIAGRRVETCTWNRKGADRRLVLGIVIALLGIGVSVYSIRRLSPIPDFAGGPAIAAIANAIATPIRAIVANPLNWVGWFGFYWIVLAIKRKRLSAGVPARTGVSIRRVLLGAGLGSLVVAWIICVSICKTDLHRLGDQQRLLEMAFDHTPPALSQSEGNAVFTAFEQRINKLNEDYGSANWADTWRANDMNEASSFCNSTAATRITMAMTDLDELEHKYNKALHQLPGQALLLAHRRGLNDRQKRRFLEQHLRLAELFQAETDFMGAQHEWLQNNVELYRFVAGHCDRVRVRNYKVVFSDPALNDEFQAQWKKDGELINKMNAAEDIFHAYQYPPMRRSEVARAGPEAWVGTGPEGQPSG